MGSRRKTADYVEYKDLNEDGRLVWDVLGKEAALKRIRAAFRIGLRRLHVGAWLGSWKPGSSWTEQSMAGYHWSGSNHQ